MHSFDASHLQGPLSIHQEGNWRLVHVKDKMLATVRTNDNATHHIHLVRHLCGNLVRFTLGYMHAHTIDKRMGTHESPCSTCPCYKVCVIVAGSHHGKSDGICRSGGLSDQRRPLFDQLVELRRTCDAMYYALSNHP